MAMIGDIILIHLRTHYGKPDFINGSSIVPAIVTGIIDDDLINCRMFADNQEVAEHLSSVPLIGTHDDWRGHFWEPKETL